MSKPPQTIDLKLVKQKPKLIEWLPGVGKATCQAVYPNIYVPRHVYASLQSDNPEPRYIAVLLHEQEHLLRMKQSGVLKWNLRYAFSRKFRLDEELAAVKPQKIYLLQQGEAYDDERKAKLLSSWLYFWSTSYDKALEKLKQLN
ncbi:MAG TPA: hypothetical protein VIJ68_01530 [Candidatus Saccharimonadales bacterium]